jgi:hypothetical protein
MARKWWGTVNLPADVAGTCSTPWYHVPARAETRWMVRLGIAHEEHASKSSRGAECYRGSWGGGGGCARDAADCFIIELAPLSLLNAGI